MTALPSLKRYFSRALAGGGGRLHLAAHSHHLWPDVTFNAQTQAWQDAATLWDGKWTKVFGGVVPEAQGHIARHLRLSDPATIVFAPNTHEFVLRLLSALPSGRVPRLLTTDGEFHSFSRQALRLAEEGLLTLELVPVQPFADFPARFMRAAADGHDMVFLSHVFFNSGYAVPDLDALVAGIPDGPGLIVIDGYHAFMARPVDLSGIGRRAFYMAGGYKYACAGEGACFMACPPGVAPRPRNTGWYAAFGALSEAAGGLTAYPQDGRRFMGASFDPSGLYRLNAVMRWMHGLGMTVEEVHARALAMQRGFLDGLDRAGIAGLGRADLVLAANGAPRGNFLAFRSPHASRQQTLLEGAGIVTDVRGDVLRVGFGLYHDPDDVPTIVARVRAALG